MPDTTAPEVQPAALLDYDVFLRDHVGGHTDRELLIACLYGQHKLAVAVKNLHGLVERIENEANETISSFNSPDAMAEMARKFLTGG